jgi:hypothetical protein
MVLLLACYINTTPNMIAECSLLGSLQSGISAVVEEQRSDSMCAYWQLY